MPLALLIVGIVIIITAFRGTYTQLGTLIKGDFQGGPGTNFLYWLLALIAVGSIGFIPKMSGVSKALLGLIILGILISNKGFFSKFAAAVQNPATAVAGTPEPKAPGPATVQLSSAVGTPVEVTGPGAGQPVPIRVTTGNTVVGGVTGAVAAGANAVLPGATFVPQVLDMIKSFLPGG